MSVSGLERTARIENPENIAFRALGFLSVRRPLFDRFLADSAFPIAALTCRPIGDDVAVTALDFILADELALREFTERTDITIEALYATRRFFAAREEMSSDGHVSVPLASISRIFDAVREPPVVEARWAAHARHLPQVSGSKPGI